MAIPDFTKETPDDSHYPATILYRDQRIEVGSALAHAQWMVVCEHPACDCLLTETVGEHCHRCISAVQWKREGQSVT